MSVAIWRATFLAQQNADFPDKWTAIDVVDAVCDLPLDLFARHPRLRRVCLTKILELRHHSEADDDVLEAFERLRVVLEEALDVQPWTDDEFDAEFRACVRNPDLVIDTRETVLDEASQLDTDSE